jgi:hypothetical protein
VVRYNFIFQSLVFPVRVDVVTSGNTYSSTKNSLITWGLGFVVGDVKVTAMVKVKDSPMVKRKGLKGLGSNRYSGPY